MTWENTGPPGGSVATRPSAKVQTEGVNMLVDKFDKLLTKLKQVRAEMSGLGTVTIGGGNGTMTGSSNSSTQQLQSMTSGWRTLGIGTGMMMAGSLFGGINNAIQGRYNNVLAQSLPIASADAFRSSMYGPNLYAGMEGARLGALGKFAGTRQDATQAQSIGLRYGMTYANSLPWLNTVSNVVQAGGGTITAPQAAGMSASFADPMVMRRGRSMGVTPIKQNGVMANPLTQAQSYIKNFEKRAGITLNEIDFANMRSPGSSLRYTFQRMYGLSDEALDTIVQAGAQNIQFKGVSGGRSINFNSSSDLDKIGLGTNRAGLKAYELMSAGSKRDARFFRNNESSMVGRMDSEISLQNVLSDVENAFGDLTGKMYEFGRVLDVALRGLTGLGGALSLLGLGGMGRGFGGGMFGGGGGGGVGGGGGGGGMGIMGRAGAAVGGAALAYGGSMMAGQGGAAGIAGVGMGIAGGAMAGMAIGGPWGAAAGAVIGGGYSAVKFFDGMNSRDVAKKAQVARGLTEDQLIKSFGNYNGKMSPGRFGASGAGPGEKANFDEFQRRRGALMAAAFGEGVQTDAFGEMTPDDAAWINRLITYYSGQDPANSVVNDEKWGHRIYDAQRWAKRLQSTPAGMEIYKKYFGSVMDPTDSHHAVNTPEANAFVMSSKEIASGGYLDSNSGDPTGDGAPGGKGAGGSTWDRLDSRMKSRLQAMFSASGGKVWLGNGWRSEDQQRSLFLSRYEEDPNGDVSWNGKKWKRVRGAPAAPPGRSMHEIGLAADLEGDLNWVKQNASRFGLKTFGDVNGEPWHVQPAELPNSRADYEGGGGGASSSSGNVVADGAVSGGGGGSGSAGGSSGIGYSIAASAAGTRAGGKLTSSMLGAAASTTAGSGGNSAGGALTPEQIAIVAHNAGFMGADLVNMVAIAMRESHGNSMATNERNQDRSYGLWQINLKPWQDKGIAAPWTKEQLYDPSQNAAAAMWLFKQNGMKPWNLNGNPMSNTSDYMAQATAAVQGLGFGDPMGGGGGTSFHFDSGAIVIHSQGNTAYDAEEFLRQVHLKTGARASLDAKRVS